MRKIILFGIAIMFTAACAFLSGGGIKAKCGMDAYFNPNHCWYYPYFKGKEEHHG